MRWGQSSTQYRQAVQGTAGRALSSSATWASRARSSPVRGAGAAMKAVFSSSWDMSDMPLSTMTTPSSPAAKRMAQEAGDQSGWAWRRMAAASSGSLASFPPFTGSITTTCLPWRRTVS